VVYWYNKASDLRGSAGAIWSAMHEPNALENAEHLGLGKGFSFSIAGWPVYLMLCGMALELLLKTILLEQGKEPKLTHNLVELAKDAGLSFDEKQLGLLSILSESIYWDGRYPVPKEEKRFAQLAELRKEHLFEEVPIGTGILKFYRSNGALRWESFNELWQFIHSYHIKPHP
jgi:hypothetical protein